MKSFVVFALLAAVACAAPPNPADANAQIIRSELENIGVDGFQYGYETSNGIAAQARAQLVDAGTEAEALEAQGGYSYTGPDGIVYRVSWTAGRDGFKPEGEHLPRAPAA